MSVVNTFNKNIPPHRKRDIMCTLVDERNHLMHLFFGDHSMATYDVEDYRMDVVKISHKGAHSDGVWDINVS